MIDPTDRTVHCYADDFYAQIDGNETSGLPGQGVVTGFVLDLEEVWRSYE